MAPNRRNGINRGNWRARESTPDDEENSDHAIRVRRVRVVSRWVQGVYTSSESSESSSSGDDDTDAGEGSTSNANVNRVTRGRGRGTGTVWGDSSANQARHANYANHINRRNGINGLRGSTRTRGATREPLATIWSRPSGMSDTSSSNGEGNSNLENRPPRGRRRGRGAMRERGAARRRRTNTMGFTNNSTGEGSSNPARHENHTTGVNGQGNSLREGDAGHGANALVGPGWPPCEAPPDDLIFEVSQAQYYVPRKPLGPSLIPRPCDNPESMWLFQFSLASVFVLPEDPKFRITGYWLQTTVNEWERSDDVFHRAFLTTIIFWRAENNPGSFDIDISAREYMKIQCNVDHLCISASNGEILLPGPYAVIEGRLQDLWRLYADVNQTCIQTLKPHSLSPEPQRVPPGVHNQIMPHRSVLPLLQRHGMFEIFSTNTPVRPNPYFAVRSRIKERASFPLNPKIAGLRILVSDNMNLWGIRTGFGSRAFYDTYGDCKETDECIRNMCMKGVAIVGRAKMASFGLWEEPTEYHECTAPFNPRGDEFQSPGGCSSGAAAAVAAYSWLDLAIGSDSWAGIARPSLWCGCFGLRTGSGVVFKGCWRGDWEPSCTRSMYWDSFGLLTRDLKLCRNFVLEWFNTRRFGSCTKLLSSVVWATDFWSIADDLQTDMARAFAKKLQKTLGLRYEEVSFEEAWKECPPPEANGASLPEYINEAVRTVQDYDTIHQFDEFLGTFERKFKAVPITSSRFWSLWAAVRKIPKRQRDAHYERLCVYKRWFESIILDGIHPNPLIIMPIEFITPRYRDDSPEFERPPQPGVSSLVIAPVLGTPVLSIPIGEVSYKSRISNRVATLPFVVSVMGRQGSEMALIESMLEVLEAAGLPTCVNVGLKMGDCRY